MTGQPAIALPLHVDADGLPIGVQLVAAPAVRTCCCVWPRSWRPRRRGRTAVRPCRR
nr:amidase family protein [Kibdelosporangium sp. MJ126-NF4]